MRINSIEDLLELLVEVNEVFQDTCECGQLSIHDVQLLVHLNPLKIIKPVSWVSNWLNFTGGTSEEESPLLAVNLVVAEQNLHAKQEREQ